jgi:hypothetical protein
MGKPERELSRSEWASWLKMVARTSLADRLPPTHEPSGMSPADYASALLEELRNVASDLQARPSADVIAEVRESRRWVEARLKVSRRTILEEGFTDRDVADFANRTNSFDHVDDVTPTMVSEYLQEMGWSQPGPASTSKNDLRDPMWDEFLDGL